MCSSSARTSGRRTPRCSSSSWRWPPWTTTRSGPSDRGAGACCWSTRPASGWPRRGVGWLAFIASLVRSLAWPAAVVAIVLVLRRPLVAALNRGVRRLRAGPIEVEFDEELAEVRQELAQAPELREAPEASGQSLDEELARLTEVSPRAAVMEAFARIEVHLGELLGAAGVDAG